MTEPELMRGLNGLFTRLKAEYELRKRQRLPHPGTLYLNTEAYDYMLQAMDIVNARIGIPAPQDSLYSFKGMKLRRAREKESG